MFATDAGTFDLQRGCWDSAISMHYHFVSFNLKVDAFEPLSLVSIMG